jgi:ferredoxin-NADP reductase
MAPPTNTYQSVTITAIRQETPGVKTFLLAAEDGSTISYAAGQFITFVLDHHGKEERRSFSISSAGAASNPLTITVKRVDNGIYSRFLHDKARVGDKLQTTGAAGLFTLPQNLEPYRQVFFFAAGIGITPIFSLIKSLLNTHSDAQAVLIYSSTNKEDTVFHKELDALAASYPHQFKIAYLFSSSFDLSRARLSKALLPVLMQEYGTVPKAQMLCYTCGSFAYMRMVIYALEEYGIPHPQIRKENFNTEVKPTIKAEPPDKDAHKVTIIHNGAQHQFTCQYPQTILQAAKHNGINLPYSCETGRCGSCAAICKSGKVWLSYNEVLMDVDLQHGSTLTCTGYPVGGDVVIEV